MIPDEPRRGTDKAALNRWGGAELQACPTSTAGFPLMIAFPFSATHPDNPGPTALSVATISCRDSPHTETDCRRCPTRRKTAMASPLIALPADAARAATTSSRLASRQPDFDVGS